MLVRRYTEYTTAQGGDFLFRNTRGILVNKEIELHFTAVDVAVVIHHYRLNTTANHFANNLGHPNRFLRVMPADSLIYGMSIDIAHISYCFPCTSRAPQLQKKLPLFNEILLLYLAFNQYAPSCPNTAPTVRSNNTQSPSIDQLCT